MGVRKMTQSLNKLIELESMPLKGAFAVDLNKLGIKLCHDVIERLRDSSRFRLIVKGTAWNYQTKRFDVAYSRFVRIIQ